MANQTRAGRTVPVPPGQAAAGPVAGSVAAGPVVARPVAADAAAGLAARPATRRVAGGGLVGVLALPVADSVGLAAGALSVPDVIAPVLYALAALAALSLSGLHRLRISLRVSDQIGRVLAAVVLPVLLVLPLLPAASAVRLALTSAGLVVVGRLVTSAGLRAARRRGRLTETALIIGSGTFGAFLAQQIREHPELGLRVRRLPGRGRPAPRPARAGPWRPGRPGQADRRARHRPGAGRLRRLAGRGPGRHRAGLPRAARRRVRGAAPARAGPGRAARLPGRDLGGAGHPAAPGRRRRRPRPSSGPRTC